MVLIHKLYNLTKAVIHGLEVDQLRGIDGKFITNAYKAETKSRLRKVFDRGDNEQRQQKLDARNFELTIFRQAKRKLQLQGFKHGMSTFGRFTNKVNQETKIKRVEILSKEPFNSREVAALHDLFKKTPPKSDLSLFAWRGSDESLAAVIT